MYIAIDGNSIWDVYTEDKAQQGLYRGGGNASSPRTFKEDKGKGSVRPLDFKIVFDPATKKEMVFPDPTRGLSFSNSLQRLKDIPIKGKVWLLLRGKRLPEGLFINYRTIDHPLINVAYKMSVEELVGKLKQLEALMEYTGVTIA
jgi:hypothetical protein